MHYYIVWPTQICHPDNNRPRYNTNYTHTTDSLACAAVYTSNDDSVSNALAPHVRDGMGLAGRQPQL